MGDSILNLIINAVDNASNVLKGVSTNAQSLGKTLESVGGGMQKLGGTLTMVTAPLTIFGAQSIKVASDFEEMSSKFKAVFKDFSGQVEENLGELAVKVNRSKADLMGFAATLQDTFVPLGFARDKAAEMSQSVVELAVDLSSFNNVSEETAIADMQSALVGNTETVRKYGIVITQATLDQELLNMGVAGGVAQATEAEKAQGRLNLIMAGSADAMGDAERTSGSFANQMRGLQSTIKELQTDIGSRLIPIFSPLITKVQEGVRWFQGLDDKTKDMIVRVGLVVVALGPVLVVVGTLISTLGSLIASWGAVAGVVGTVVGSLSTVLPIIALVAGAAYLLYTAWNNNFGGIQDIVKMLAEKIKNIFDNLVTAWNTIKPHLENLMAKLNELYERFKPIIDIMNKVFLVFMLLPVIMGGAVIVALILLIEKISEFAGPVLSAVIDAVSFLVVFMTDTFTEISNFLIPIFTVIGQVFNEVWNEIVMATTVAMDVINNLIVPIITIIVRLTIIQLMELYKGFMTVFNWIRANIIDPFVNWFMTEIYPTIAKVVGWISGAIQSMVGPIQQANQQIYDIFNSIWNGIVGLVKSYVNGIIGQMNWFISGLNTMLSGIDKIGASVGVDVNYRLGSIPSFAGGADFIVPSGYSGDNYPFRANLQSGERVQITPRDQVNNNQKSVNIETVVFNNNQEFDAFIDKLSLDLK